VAADSAAITTAPGTTLTATRRTTAPSMPRLGAPRSTTAVFRLAESPRAQVDAANVLQHVVLKAMDSITPKSSAF
jgi:hypothetical protein